MQLLNSACDCVEPCKRTVYTPRISNAALSRLSISDLITTDIELFHAQMWNATNIQFRVSEEKFLAISSALHDVMMQYTEFIKRTAELSTTFQSDIVSPGGSAILDLMHMFVQDFDGTLLDGLDESIKYLDVVYTPTKNAILLFLDKTNEGVETILLYVTNFITFGKAIPHDIDNLSNKTVDAIYNAFYGSIQYIGFIMNVTQTLESIGYEYSDLPLTFKPVILVPPGGCDQFLSQYQYILLPLIIDMQTMIELLDHFNASDEDVYLRLSFHSNFTNEITQYVRKIFDSLAHLRTLNVNFKSRCLEPFYNILDEIKFTQSAVTRIMKDGQSLHNINVNFTEDVATLEKDQSLVQSVYKQFVLEATFTVQDMLTNMSKVSTMFYFGHMLIYPPKSNTQSPTDVYLV